MVASPGRLIGSKLNGLLSVGGGSGDTGDMMSIFASSFGFSLGDGVISGVIVSIFAIGGGGAGLCAFSTLKPVLLLPLTCFGEMGPPLARGLDGSPMPMNALRGGAGAGNVPNFSSSGVGGSRLIVTGSFFFSIGFSIDSSRDTLFGDPTEFASPVLFFLGADVGNGPAFPPRGPAPRSA